MLLKLTTLRAVVSSFASVMSKFVHPSKPIFNKYPSWPKNHKLQGVVLAEVDAKVVGQGANEILVFVFTHSNFTNQNFYSDKRYIHVNKEGEEDSLFVLVEDVVPTAITGGIGPLVDDGNNYTGGAEANDDSILLSGCTSNIRLEHMVELRCQGIAINDDNDPAPDNVPIQGETIDGTGNWMREGIICSRRAGNLQNNFASFRHYPHDAILCMSLLQFFLLCSQRIILSDSSFPRPKRG